MKAVKQILQDKATNEVFHVSPDTSVLEALKVMADKNIGALLVVDNDRLVGIFSERDYARKVILLGKRSASIPVSSIMTKELIVVHPDTPGEECMALVTERHIRHLPVVDNDKIVGMLSIGDLVRERIADQAHVIKQLERYIYHS